MLVALVAVELALRLRPRGGAAPAVPLNSHGFRGPECERQRDARGVRVIVLGDESSFGAALAEEHTWPRQLEGLFARDGMASRVEVLNVSTPELDAAAALDQLEQRVLAFEPTWLIVSLGVRDAVLPLLAAPPVRWWSRSRLACAILGAAQPQGSTIEPHRPVARTEFPELRRRAEFDFGVQVARLVERARARRVEVLVLSPPWRWNPDGATSTADSLSGPLLPPRSAAAELHRALLQELGRVAEATGAPIVDGAAALGDGRGAFDSRGGLTAEGAARMAQGVHAELRRRMR